MSVTRHQAVGAYQPWKPPAFDKQGQSGESAADSGAAAAHGDAPAENDTAPAQPAIKLPTAEEIEEMFEQARHEGYGAGHEEGHAAGLDEGRKAGFEEGRTAGFEAGQTAGLVEVRAQTTDIAARLTALVGTMDQAIDAMGQDIAEEIVTLAIELARQMIKHTLDEHPEAVTEIVRQALLLLPQAKVNIHLNPDDVALVHEYLGDQIEHGHHRLIDDETITRGGCKLEAANSEVDATMEIRWRRILEGLGRTGNEWNE